MDWVLVSITGISLVLALVMGLIVFKLQREEQERADARAALLAAAVADMPSMDDERDALASDFMDASRASASGDLFVTHQAESSWLRRAGVAIAVAAVIASAGYVVTFIGSPAPSRAAVQADPLELVALQHSYENNTLIITGTVLNPAMGATASQIAVSAVALSADGTALGSGRAALDYATLTPGDESGFEIKIPVQGTVSRYRVGFRRPDGSVVAHVDRRTSESSARNTGSTGSAPWVR